MGPGQVRSARSAPAEQPLSRACLHFWTAPGWATMRAKYGASPRRRRTARSRCIDDARINLGSLSTQLCGIADASPMHR
eukprot:8509543-Pyramimonas_sp.AAC.1